MDSDETRNWKNPGIMGADRASTIRDEADHCTANTGMLVFAGMKCHRPRSSMPSSAGTLDSSTFSMHLKRAEITNPSSAFLSCVRWLPAISFLPGRKTDFVSRAERQISAAQLQRDGLANALQRACRLQVQHAGQRPSIDRFAHALQMADDCVQHLRAKREPQFRVDIPDDLLPSFI